MTPKEIINELREEVTLLLNCTDDERVKEKLLYILNGEKIDLCKCPQCGETFPVNDDTMKGSMKVL